MQYILFKRGVTSYIFKLEEKLINRFFIKNNEKLIDIINF